MEILRKTWGKRIIKNNNKRTAKQKKPPKLPTQTAKYKTAGRSEEKKQAAAKT